MGPEKSRAGPAKRKHETFSFGKEGPVLFEPASRRHTGGPAPAGATTPVGSPTGQVGGQVLGEALERRVQLGSTAPARPQGFIAPDPVGPPSPFRERRAIRVGRKSPAPTSRSPLGHKAGTRSARSVTHPRTPGPVSTPPCRDGPAGPSRPQTRPGDRALGGSPSRGVSDGCCGSSV